jgi:hypothetical protein
VTIPFPSVGAGQQGFLPWAGELACPLTVQ